MPAGISEGNYHWLGDYEQCEGLKVFVFYFNLDESHYSNLALITLMEDIV